MKKKICAVLAAALLLTCFTPTAFAAGTLGDINTDNNITAEDARLALRAAVGLEELNETQKDLADVDADGSVTAADARLALRTATGLEPEIVKTGDGSLS